MLQIYANKYIKLMKKDFCWIFAVNHLVFFSWYDLIWLQNWECRRLYYNHRTSCTGFIFALFLFPFFEIGSAIFFFLHAVTLENLHFSRILFYLITSRQVWHCFGFAWDLWSIIKDPNGFHYVINSLVYVCACMFSLITSDSPTIFASSCIKVDHIISYKHTYTHSM